ncbi:DUF2812 domain-containing protein [Nonomuraea africana]|uniref:DUF2812 domain-containing protein n=1 Tax=Nonomuraea africana TaxID=46171 RepID=A0ABR9KM46_9ACTN|nr:DUF2812 domain-containing protein [Nonomuraea africana]MBE1563089.1 hypothetical protein [Nonomuraea africana]
MSGYFDELAVRLRERGVPEDTVTATVADLTAYLAESGGDPEEEFGPAAGFARQLGAAPATENAAESSTWRWTADIFVDEHHLNEFGDQGWEVDRVDAAGRFVCHRDEDNPQRWEYRREVVTRKGRPALVEELAPDGWEPCGTWFFYEYFKRPKAASLGPDAELGAPPRAPGKGAFFSKRFFLLIGFCAVCLVLSLVLLSGVSGGGAGFLVGLLAGAAGGALAALGALWFQARRGRDGSG